jgi:4-oxalocrotonate tautomerase
MPHVIVKLWPGKSEQQKKELAEEVTKVVMFTLNYGEESVSVGIEEVKPQDWTRQVYEPDILGKRETIYNTRSRDTSPKVAAALALHRATAALDGFGVRGVKLRSGHGRSAPRLYFRAEHRAGQDRGNRDMSDVDGARLDLS